MKKLIALILVFTFVCLSAVYAEGDSATATLVLDKARFSVGDEITVTVRLTDITSGEFVGCDAAVFYDSSVLKFNAESGIKVSDALKEKGVSRIYSDTADSVVRCAVGFGIDALDKIPATVGDSIDVWYIKFTVIAEGDTCLGFAIEGKTPKFDDGLETGIEAYLGDRTNKADIKILEKEEPEREPIITDGGAPSILITEIKDISGITVPVGTTAEEAVALLPEEAEVLLSNGKTGTVKMEWTAGSMVSGFDGNTPGDYYFTGNISDSGEYKNYNNLFSLVKVTVEKDYKTEIVMVIGSPSPTINGEAVSIDVPALIIDSRTLTPARFVAEALGAEVLWDDETKTVTIKDENNEIVLVINSKTALINGEEIETDVPAMIIDSRTLTPSRLVAEALGAEVLWDDETKTVTIRK